MATTDSSAGLSGAAANESFWIEKHSIDPVPEDERTGKLYTAFTVWIAFNATPLSIAGGAFGIALGLPIWACILAIVLGSVIGALPTSMHAQQGPRLGIPQMIQSRAQFGFYGNLIPSLGTLFVYFVYSIFGIVLCEQGLSGLFHWSTVMSTVVSCVAMEVIVLVGYRLIHLVEAWLTVICVILFVMFTVRLFTEASQIHYTGKFALAAFLFVLCFEVVGQLGNAPMISDYTRYLPSKTKGLPVFLGAFLGGGGGAILMTAVGVIAAALNFNAVNTDTVGFMSSLFPPISGLLVILLVATVCAIVGMGVYSGYQTSIALVTSKGGQMSAIWSRAIFSVAFLVVCGAVSLSVSSNFINDIGNLVTLLVYMLIPWSAINLTDFFLVRRGRYDVAEITDRKGKYGLINWRTVAVFVVAVLAEVPFITSSYPSFTGPIANAMGGLNFAWLVGFVVAAGLYWLVTHSGAQAEAAPQLAQEA